MNKLITTLFVFILPIFGALGQKYNTSFGQNGYVAYDDQVNIITHNNHFYVENRRNISGTKEEGYMNELTLEKYDKNGKRDDNFGLDGYFILSGYMKLPHKRRELKFIGDYFAISTHTPKDNGIEIYDLKGEFVFRFTFKKIKFKIDQILEMKPNQTILFGVGSKIKSFNPNTGKPKEFADTSSKDISNRPKKSQFNPSSRKINSKYYLNYELHYDDHIEYKSAVYNLKGKLLSDRILYKSPTESKSHYWFQGSAQNLAIAKNNEEEFCFYPVNIFSEKPKKQVEIKLPNRDWRNYITKSKKGNIYITEKILKSYKDKTNISRNERNTVIRAFNRKGKRYKKFGEKGVLEFNKKYKYRFFRLNENELIILEENYLGNSKYITKIKKLRMK